MAHKHKGPNKVTTSSKQKLAYKAKLLLATILVSHWQVNGQFIGSKSNARRLWYPKQATEAAEKGLMFEPVGMRKFMSSIDLLPQLTELEKHQDVNTNEPSGMSKRAQVISPLSYQILDVDPDGSMQRNGISFELPDSNRKVGKQVEQRVLEKSDPNEECRTIRSPTRLLKDELDPVSKQTLRTCRDIVHLNRCEGSCISGVEPSVRSPIGLLKDCSCCNEGSFRRLQVRLTECFVVTGDGQQGRRILEEPASFMDIEIDEPTECRCRRCVDGAAI